MLIILEMFSYLFIFFVHPVLHGKQRLTYEKPNQNIIKYRILPRVSSTFSTDVPTHYMHQKTFQMNAKQKINTIL